MRAPAKSGDREAGGDEDRIARFKAFYSAYYVAISAYVRRRVPEHDSADVVAQVFTVAWRRLADVPAPPSDRPWLYGVARRAVADYRRTSRRRLRLLERLADEAAHTSSSADDPGPARGRVEAAIGRLRPKDREVLTLRLRRARGRVREVLLATETPIDPSVAPPAAAARH
jgi:RNA polymerase sigma-70 factor (ECF subfamily)